MQLRNQQSATESYAELASKNTNSYLVDVRSSQEWQNDGVADLSNNQEKVILCEWRRYPSMELNEDFFSKLTEKLILSEVDDLYFICAAGVRSQEAADFTDRRLKDLDFSIRCINIFDGFNGNTNSFFNLKKSNGWKASGLPCCQLKQPINKN